MRRSSNAIVFIAAGLYLALGAVAGYATVNAVLLLLLGIHRYRSDRSRLSVVVIAISTLVLIVNQFALFVVVVLVSLGIYYFRARPPEFGTHVSNHRLFMNMRMEEQSWVLRSMSYWHAFGEIHMDMSLAVPEEKETTIVLQGVVGNVDLIVPEDYGMQVEASVLIGQASFRQIQEGGMIQRLSWKSPNYEQSEQKLKLQLFYLVGDIKIRTV
ncbi:cell wall-active antibiotics response protein [Cohnella sp. LGH]|uniref:cell wall-active antibiotics response protein LiaF n=1 Tax=unclassified Cohnella TaxID=2636738 RepID=UPI001ADD53FC|nr:cell wall-active antibiotics response protein LiaF [Cohnella sp. LGH]QTH40069.1 cell wall-active antibiotics response protein [Cohnella sp. LGH]